jgi:hypothetical protein
MQKPRAGYAAKRLPSPSASIGVRDTTRIAGRGPRPASVAPARCSSDGRNGCPQRRV